MSYMKLRHVDSDMTRQFEGTKVDFMEPIKPLGKSAWYLTYRIPGSLTKIGRASCRERV